MIAGQFYITSPDHTREEERLKKLAREFEFPLTELKDAASKIPVLNKSQQAQVQEWTPKVAGTVQSILCERSDLLERLERIAELSVIQPTLHK